MNDVSYINKTDEDVLELSTLKELVSYALKKEEANNVVFSIVFVNDDEIHQLNKQYRNIDRATDVLSFAFEDNDDLDNEEIRVLGDIYISLDKAHSQALDYGHSYLRELSFLTIHGILHLLGYDHIEPEAEKIMFARQEAILDEFGIKR